MRFEIRSVKNGAILRVEYDAGDEPEVEELVYQEPDEEGNEVDAFAEFLWAITEHYGPSTSRHSPKRISIHVEPGDKYEDSRPRTDQDRFEPAPDVPLRPLPGSDWVS